jgi:hypothetical protein
MKPGSIAKGFGIGVLLTAGGIGICFAVSIFVVIGIGVAQLLWILPTYLYYNSRNETETAKGLLIVAGLVFLLNASCWGILMSNNFRLG